MEIDKRELAQYMAIIKKAAYKKIIDTNHKQFIEDVTQEVFMKLYKQDFFSKSSIATESEKKSAWSYINMTVNSCYMDMLSALGINRRLTKAERAVSNNKYENIQSNDIDDLSEGELKLTEVQTPEQQHFAQEAYSWIKECYTSLLAKISDANRKVFFETAFWKFNDYDMSLKSLALHLGYSSSNPTQELKRFIEKVSMCTQPHGVVVNNANEQIQFLREQMETQGEVL